MKLSFVTILVSIIFAQGFSSPLSSISTSSSSNNNNYDNYSQQIYNHDLNNNEKEGEIGYMTLFQSNTEEFDDMCIEVNNSYPAYAEGDYIISSVGMFEYGGKIFQGVLDGFGKLHRFTMKGNKVCATYRIMSTGFYNESKKEKTVGPGLLFYQTEPPRKCPLLKPMCNLQAPNDNSFVYTVNVGDEIFSTTDSTIMVSVDPKSLNVTDNFKISSKNIKFGEIAFVGSAHPVKHPETQNWVDFYGSSGMIKDATNISAYQMIGGRPDIDENRKPIANVEMETAPYMHSFGISQNYLVFPHTPIMFNIKGVFAKSMAGAFKDLPVESDQCMNNAFYITPLNNNKTNKKITSTTVRFLPKSFKLYYVHTLNTYENASGIVLDITTAPGNPFNKAMDTIQGQRNKTARDISMKIYVTRFLLPWDNNTKITSQTFSDRNKKTEFPKINPKFSTKKYCYYWAVTWFSDNETYASMAIIKQDMCNFGKPGATLEWKRPNWYVSEPMMIPATDGKEEDDGIVVFPALNGNEGKTYYITLNAKTMEEISVAGPFPHIPYSAHGHFYPKGTFK